MPIAFKLIIASLFIPVFGLAQYKNLVFKGGGIRGIAYTGAIEVLEEKHVMPGIENVAGTSVGSIVAALVSVGYTGREMKDIMFDLEIKLFNDGKWFFVGGQKRLRRNFGWYRGEAIEKWTAALIEKKTGNANITFGQLHKLALTDKSYKDLYITATNLTLQKATIFSWRTYPDMPVKTAVKASTAIPLYYSAVVLDSSGQVVRKPRYAHNSQVFVDGGILENYPVELFDSGKIANKQTLGLNLTRPEQIAYNGKGDGLAPYTIATFGNYMGALYNVIIEHLNRTSPLSQDKWRTIYLSTDNINPKVRGITTEQKTKLSNNGRAAVTDFFNRIAP